MSVISSYITGSYAELLHATAVNMGDSAIPFIVPDGVDAGIPGTPRAPLPAPTYPGMSGTIMDHTRVDTKDLNMVSRSMYAAFREVPDPI